MDYLDENNRLAAAPEPRWIATPKRVRAIFAGVAIADSRRAFLFRGGGPPIYYFPKDDIRLDLLAPSGRTENNPRGSRVLSDIRVGERVAQDAAWECPEPAADVPFLYGMLSLRWSAMDAWFEESEEVFVHARDPFKRIDAISSDCRVEVIAAGVKVADSNSPVILLEPGHPLRYYLPKADIQMQLLRPSETTSRCPYKGQANYYSLQITDDAIDNAAWSYHFTTTESAKIAGLVCFFNERVDAIIVDGQQTPKPRANWAR